MEVAYVDPVQGNVVITCDGTVVEHFVEGKASVARVHVRQLYLEVKGPHRKGFYEINFNSAPNGLGGFKTFVAGDDWPRVAEFLNAVPAAGRR